MSDIYILFGFTFILGILTGTLLCPRASVQIPEQDEISDATLATMDDAFRARVARRLSRS